MLDTLKSAFGFTWAMSLFGLRQMMQPQNSAKWFDVVARAARERLSEPLRRIHDADSSVGTAVNGQAPANPGSSVRAAVDSGRLNTGAFVVIGEGLAAGVSDFTLHQDCQRNSFAAQMAQQMGATLEQPLFEAPGIGSVPGMPQITVRVPAPPQGTVLTPLRSRPLGNLSIPSYTLHDALHRRPEPPLVHRYDHKQTACNLILGLHPIARNEFLPTQLEYAVDRQPTFAIVCLGYTEALEAAVSGNENRLPDPDHFAHQFREIVSRLKGVGADVLVCSIPDPFDTAHFSSLSTAARILKVPAGWLTHKYGLQETDTLTLAGLNEIGFQIFGRQTGALTQDAVLTADRVEAISNRVAALNQGIQNTGAHFFDLGGFFSAVRQTGVRVGAQTLTADYLGGFYSLSGFYPGASGNALIANEILNYLNGTFGAGFAAIDVQSVIGDDPAAQCRPAQGPDWTASQLDAMLQQHGTQSAGTEPQPAIDSNRDREGGSENPALPLRLPDSLEQVLPLSKAVSYFGDGIGAVNARNPRDIQWGSGGNYLFGGLAMVDSHLTGNIRITFTEPVQNLTHFTVSFEGGFTGDDEVLVTPGIFKMAFQQNRVNEVPGQISGGTLNLATGEVSDLTIYAQYMSGALMALVSVNPTWPKQPMSFPGPYGSAWALFEQRDDGNLDFLFYGSTFVPLGPNILWPLNFVGPSMQFAVIPANGTVMHPHLSLGTRDTRIPGNACPDIPFNTLQEYTIYTHNSAFGDQFTLEVPQLGGPAKGRSHVMGRVQVQFGSRTGNSVPVAVSLINPGGVLAAMELSPITEVFPGRLSPGAQGYYEQLQFPLRSYSLNDLEIIDDPFDVSIGAVDLASGHFLADLLHRGFIHQDLIFALLRVEPRTPKSSFYFRGPARFEKGASGQPVFRFQGTVRVPYPAGFSFPQPNLATGYIVGPNSVLDPFLWVRAIQGSEATLEPLEGDVRNTTSSTGQPFSYRYRIPPGGRGEAIFEYENHAQNGSYRMYNLAWVSFENSDLGANGNGHRGYDRHADTVTFSGFGVWSKDGLQTIQQAAVQISTSPTTPYVGIQIGLGDVSNVNTKPVDETTALP